MTKQEAVRKLRDIGACVMVCEDALGDTKKGWWLDGVWLAPEKDPIGAWSAISGG